MDKKTELHRKRMRRRLRASIFLRKNGIYIAIALCLAVIGGISAVMLGGSGESPEAPAGQSLDERLGEASNTAAPTKAPSPTPSPAPHGGRTAADDTPAPSLIPDITPAPSASPAPGITVNWTPPVDGRLIRVYAMDCLIYSKTLGQWMTHSGVDIAAPKGTEVRSVDAGRVVKVYDDDMLGTTVVIEHPNGVTTVYAGLKKDPPVKTGDTVAARGVIGYIGDTAISECAEESHLHFEIRVAGKPVDPRGYIVFKSDGD